MLGLFLGCMSCNWDDTPDPKLRDDVDECLAAAGYSNKAASYDAGCDASQWTKYHMTGRHPLFQLMRLSERFWEHFLPRLAARFGMSVVSIRERGACEALIAVARALDGGDSVSREEQDRIVNALISLARQVDPMRKVA